MKNKILVFLISILLLFSCATKANIEQNAKVVEFNYIRSGDVIKGEEKNQDEITIAVAATSDVHGRIYAWEYATDALDNDAGYSMTYPILKELREEYPNALVIDIGDTVQDNSAELFNDLDIHPMVEAMNKMKYDVWVLGNHEFNFNLEFLQRNIEAFKGRVITNNIKYASDGRNYVLPYQIFVIDGVRVAVIGAVAPHIPLWEASSPEHYQGLNFTHPVKEMKRTIKELEGKYDVVIAALHASREGQYDNEGNGGAFNLAKEIPELDLVVAGHEHANYVTDIDGTWVMEPGRYGSHVSIGEIHLKKEDGKWKVSKVDAKNISTKENKEVSDEILDEFKWVHEKSRENANTVIGEVVEDFMPKGADYITFEKNVTTMPRAQIEDTAIMDLINNVQLKYANADISSAAMFTPNQNLFKGPFKNKDVAFIYKYNNTLMGVNISGENLLKYMEWSASYYNTYERDDVTISFNQDKRMYNYDMFQGLDYDIDLTKEAGNRIKNVKIKGEPLDPQKIYKLAINNYRYGTLEKLNLITKDDIYYDSYEEDQLNSELRALIIKYVKEVFKSKLSPIVDNNWKIINLGPYFNDKATLDKIRSGELKIMRSEDGRTPNIKSIKINE